MHFTHHLAGFAAVTGHVIGHVAAASPMFLQNDPNVHHTSYQSQAGSGDAFCDAICRQFRDGNTLISIGTTIQNVISNGGTGGSNGGNSGGTTGGRYDIITGPVIHGGPDGSCGHEASAIWKLWAQSHAHAFQTRITNLGYENGGSNKICIDASQLARLTAAATQCYSQVNGLGGSSSDSYGGGGGGGSYSYTTTTWGPMGHVPPGGVHQGGKTGSTGNAGEPPANLIVDHPNTQPPQVAVDPGFVVDNSGSGATGGGTGGSFGGGGGGSSHGSTGGINVNSGGSGGGHVTTGGNTGTYSSSGWGTGNVHTEGICFKIKSKRTDRYLTTYGSEYAFATLTGYYSVFRGYPAKGVENGYTLTEVNRNGGAVNYPVKLVTGSGLFKPLSGDKDAVWTFTPAQYGDSCWGFAGKKMEARSDWGGVGWGANYREASSGEDCVDVELEEASC